MTRYTYRTMPASVRAKFDCPVCGGKGRQRTFRHECTVNPFNVKDDGTPRSPAEVKQQSLERAKQEKERFLREPMCKACEDKLSYAEVKALVARRYGVAE